MSRDEWRKGNVLRAHDLAGEFPAHQVETLLSTIELTEGGYPPTDVWESIVRQAQTLRAGLREQLGTRLRLREVNVGE